MNPRFARIRFRLLTVENLAIVSLVYVPAAFLLSKYSFGWSAQIILCVALYFVFAGILERRPIAIACPHCTKVIITDVQWVCGFCERANKNTREFPFVGECEHCEAKPKAYKCHHRRCGELIFLSSDELEANYAKCLTVTEDVVADRLRKGVDQEILFNELQAKLEASKIRLEASRKRSPREKKQESFDEYLSGTMAAREIARAKRVEVEQLYKNDPEMRDRALGAIDDWLARES